MMPMIFVGITHEDYEEVIESEFFQYHISVFFQHPSMFNLPGGYHQQLSDDAQSARSSDVMLPGNRSRDNLNNINCDTNSDVGE